MPHRKSEEWLALRGKMLTASDAATAIGVNKYETPEGLLLKKCGLGEKFTGNAATRHGELYEDEARILYEERHGEVVHELGLCPHPVESWLGGSPDGVSESGKLVEIKCPPKSDHTWGSAYSLHATASTMYGDFRPRSQQILSSTNLQPRIGLSQKNLTWLTFPVIVNGGRLISQS